MNLPSSYAARSRPTGSTSTIPVHSASPYLRRYRLPELNFSRRNPFRTRANLPRASSAQHRCCAKELCWWDPRFDSQYSSTTYADMLANDPDYDELESQLRLLAVRRSSSAQRGLATGMRNDTSTRMVTGTDAAQYPTPLRLHLAVPHKSNGSAQSSEFHPTDDSSCTMRPIPVAPFNNSQQPSRLPTTERRKCTGARC